MKKRKGKKMHKMTKKTMKKKSKRKISFLKSLFKVLKKINNPTKCKMKINKKLINHLNSTTLASLKTDAKSLSKCH